MKKILVIGASNSSKSINKTFASYVAQQIEDVELIVADLNEMELPMFGVDLEEASGIPENAVKFEKLIADADGIVLSLAEHNGMVTAAFKNLWDWTSRIDQKFWKNKPMLLMAASPGGRGGANVLNAIKTLMPHFGGNVIADFSLPKFYENFSPEGLKDSDLNDDLKKKIILFQENI